MNTFSNCDICDEDKGERGNRFRHVAQKNVLDRRKKRDEYQTDRCDALFFQFHSCSLSIAMNFRSRRSGL